MADTATQSAPLPGDGAYLTRPAAAGPARPAAASAAAPASAPSARDPQPGDGAYLMAQNGGLPRPEQRTGDRNRKRGPRTAKPDVSSAMSSLTLEDDAHGANSGRRRGGKRGGPNEGANGRTAPRPDSEGGKKRQPAHRRGGRNEDLSASTSAIAPLNPSAATFTPGPVSSSAPGSRSQSRAGEREEGDKRRNNGRRRNGNATPKVEPPKVSSRRAAFERGSKLTTVEKQAPKETHHAPPVSRGPEPDDLNSRLTRGLRDRPFLECPICFSAINPNNHTWSCLPPHSPPEFPIDLPENQRASYTKTHYEACHTPFHIKCLRDWASRSLHEDAERLRLIDSHEEPSWRCPGCQKRRTNKVGGYRCFCGRLSNPPTSTTAPHSCNDACARKRPNCDHPCPLDCHPGPCPPCQVALVVRCPSHGTSLTVKCSTASTNDAALTPVCDEICFGKLNCGQHECGQLCHFGPCPLCDEVETVRCYCGADEKAVPCGWEPKAKKQCASVDETWIGRFACERICDAPYECGIHTCNERCHPHSLSPLPCPTSPSVITTCPCGSTPLSALSGYPRKDCLAPIPTCGSPCPKTRPCGHTCPLKCHDGECPPCHQQVERPCRCGESTLLLDCDTVRERNAVGETEFLCERVCKALRNCGRHECARVCCPLSYKAKRKGRRGVMDFDHDDDDLHTCPLVCGRLLGCGIHTCPRPDHKGACGRCLQASYEELICNCGNTVVYPPVACGATVNCVFPCARPNPPCGHPKTPHNCHENPQCPPCPFLTTKPCACGKDPAVKNVRCSQTQERVSCGQVCGKLLGCGYHRCEKTCHPGECDSCSQTCNKPKRICKHACTATCHAPAKCPETEPCATIVTQSCACGHLQQRTSCGANVANPVNRESVQLKCNSECMVRQRNARLADALGIKQPIDRTLTDWTPELRAFARQNHAFVLTVEQTFKDFFQSTRQTLILPHMPAAKRTFVIGMADAYHLGRELIDAEPNRSVQIRRRVDTRLPSPLLSAAAPPLSTRLGGLGNLRAAAPGVSPWGGGRGAATAAAAVASPPISGPTSRVASPSPATVAPSPAPAAPNPVATSTPAPAPTVPAPTAAPITAALAATYTPPVADDDDTWDQSGDEA